MKGDFSRLTFDPAKRYDSVRMQQGRVQVDADWNEQADIAAHRREQALADIIGGCCAPQDEAGFAIGANGGDLDIGVGRLYVDGILCEQLDPDLSYLDQPDYPGAEPPQAPGAYLAYLDVWKWHVTALEDPEIRETALGGRDTTTRLKTVCQVKLQAVSVGSACADVSVDVPTPGGLAARTRPESDPDDVCVVPATAGYTRLENQLYRIEVHDGGVLGVDAPTFKWSRNNASIVTDWLSQQASNSNRLVVRSTGRDRLLGFHDARWVELIDDDRELRGEPGLLVEVVAVEDDVIEIDPGALTVDINDFGEHPKIRRWDMGGASGAMPVEIPVDNDGYIPIEAGVQVRFTAGAYRPGDYWLIPARAFIGAFAGDIEWPVDGLGDPVVAQPHGIRHHICKLALVTFDGTSFTLDSDCRHTFTPLCDLAPGCCTVAVEPGEDIQAAIDSLPPAGGCVCLKTGVHEIGETLRIERSDVLLHGESPGTLVSGRVLPLLSVGVLAPRPARIQIRDIRFEATGDAGASGAPAVLALDSCDEVEIGGCAVSAPGDDVSGITLWDTDRVTISGCEISVSLHGIWVIEDSLALEVRDNRITARGSGQGVDGGAVGVFAEMQFAPCVVDGNRVEGFRVGIALTRDPYGDSSFSSAHGSRVTDNHVVRYETAPAADDVRLYAIDVAASDCRLGGNTLLHASSLYGAIRATGSRTCIDENRMTSLFSAADGIVQIPVGVRVGVASADLSADEVRVRDNVIIGAQDAVVVFGGRGIVVASNDIGSLDRGPRTGVLFDGVSGGRAEQNRISGANVAIQLDEGERNQVLGNDIEGGGTGVRAVRDDAVEIGHNRIRDTTGLAVGIGSWLGTARAAHNRSERAGHGMTGAALSIVGLNGFGELQIESCDIGDTGVSPLDGSAVSPSIGVLGFLVLQASVQSNNVDSALARSADLGDPSALGDRRAVYLLGLADLQLGTGSLGFPAQVSSNRFTGAGGGPVVQIAGFDVTQTMRIRFNRVHYSDNHCWHLNPQGDVVSVRITAAAVTATGNHFMFRIPSVPVDFGTTAAMYMGNVAQNQPASGSNILPSPQNAFNR